LIFLEEIQYIVVHDKVQDLNNIYHLILLIPKKKKSHIA